MNRVVVDATFPDKFGSIVRPVELCDAAGNVVGVFTPNYSESDLDPGISEEELDRREQEPDGRSLADILADLEKRG